MSEKLEVGSIVEGKVVRVKPFGAIVSLGNTQGLVHISQVANSFVQDINDHVKVGDMVKVKVLSIDEIIASLKDGDPARLSFLLLGLELKGLVIENESHGYLRAERE